MILRNLYREFFLHIPSELFSRQILLKGCEDWYLENLRLKTFTFNIYIDIDISINTQDFTNSGKAVGKFKISDKCMDFLNIDNIYKQSHSFTKNFTTFLNDESQVLFLLIVNEYFNYQGHSRSLVYSKITSSWEHLNTGMYTFSNIILTFLKPLLAPHEIVLLPETNLQSSGNINCQLWAYAFPYIRYIRFNYYCEPQSWFNDVITWSENSKRDLLMDFLKKIYNFQYQPQQHQKQNTTKKRQLCDEVSDLKCMACCKRVRSVHVRNNNIKRPTCNVSDADNWNTVRSVCIAEPNNV